MHKQNRKQSRVVVKAGIKFLPKASSVKRLAALQSCLQVFKVICELLILSKLNHIVEVFDIMYHCVQLLKGE